MHGLEENFRMNVDKESLGNECEPIGTDDVHVDASIDVQVTVDTTTSKLRSKRGNLPI